MKKRKMPALWVALLAMMSLAAVAQPRQPQPSLDTLLNHVRALSNAQYQGRLAGSEAYQEAARYCKEALSRYGVKPYQGEWYQFFETEWNQIENATFKSYVRSSDTRKVYVLGREFACAGMTGRGYADASVVFLGYGIDDASYDEYANVDARGKIALVLSGVPDWLPSTVTNKYRTLRDKARVAKKHGCCALVAVNMNANCPDDEVQCYTYNGEMPHLLTFPIIQPTRTCARMLFQDEKMTFDSATAQLQNTMKPQSFHFRKKFEIEINAKYLPKAVTCNVVGVYPGTDSRLNGEYVVIGASLDGVGQQGETCLFPGADYNASGVAALLESARMLQEAEEQPGRNVLFVLFGASEQQHLGSQIFVSNFNPLKRVEAFVDLSGLGGGTRVAVLGNNRYPGLYGVAKRMDSIYCNVLQAGLTTDPKGAALAFDAIGIPCINLTNVNGTRHTHQPSDIAENVDRGFLVGATRLAFQTIYELSFGDYQGRSQVSRRYKFR